MRWTRNKTSDPVTVYVWTAKGYEIHESVNGRFVAYAGGRCLGTYKTLEAAQAACEKEGAI